MKKLIVSLALVTAISINTIAQKQAKDERIETAVKKIESKCISWRRQLHEHPELSNREFNTAKLIAEHIKALGIDVREGVAKTGVVGTLKGAKPGPIIGLRADMDAL